MLEHASAEAGRLSARAPGRCILAQHSCRSMNVIAQLMPAPAMIQRTSQDKLVTHVVHVQPLSTLHDRLVHMSAQSIDADQCHVIEYEW